MKTNSKFDEVKRNGKQYLLQLRKSTDSDIIEKLESQENKNGYLKTLIRNDISGSDSVELLENKITTTGEKRLVLSYITELIKKDIQEEREEEKLKSIMLHTERETSETIRFTDSVELEMRPSRTRCSMDMTSRRTNRICLSMVYQKKHTTTLFP